MVCRYCEREQLFGNDPWEGTENGGAICPDCKTVNYDTAYYCTWSHNGLNQILTFCGQNLVASSISLMRTGELDKMKYCFFCGKEIRSIVSTDL